jgi:pyrroline-5-carboxylate reductase
MALALASQFLSSAAGLMTSDMSPEQVKAALSTPKGITLNSVVNLEKGGVRPVVIDATREAIKYAGSM